LCIHEIYGVQDYKIVSIKGRTSFVELLPVEFKANFKIENVGLIKSNQKTI